MHGLILEIYSVYTIIDSHPNVTSIVMLVCGVYTVILFTCNHIIILYLNTLILHFV